MNNDEYFKIGYISKTHGLRGEVTAVFENEIESSFLDSVFLDILGSLVPFFITQISDRGDKCFIKFESIDSIEQAVPLKGCGIYMAKNNRPKLKRGQFYDDEIIGFDVEDNILGNLGVVSYIQGAGMNKLLTVLGLEKEILVPINSPFIKSVNKSKRKIKLHLPEGYLEI